MHEYQVDTNIHMLNNEPNLFSEENPPTTLLDSNYPPNGTIGWEYGEAYPHLYPANLTLPEESK